jgi:hypothetical protein
MWAIQLQFDKHAYFLFFFFVRKKLQCLMYMQEHHIASGYISLPLININCIVTSINDEEFFGL